MKPISDKWIAKCAKPSFAISLGDEAKIRKLARELQRVREAIRTHRGFLLFLAVASTAPEEAANTQLYRTTLPEAN